MEIQPLYFQYTMPESSSGLMYVHPLQDVKQSQMWAMESQNALEQLPSAIREYLTFDTFDEDKPRYNEILDKYKNEINNLTESIKFHNDNMTAKDRIALGDLSSRIKTDMATGDLSLIRDNYLAYNMWLKDNEEPGINQPIVYEKMKEDMKNKFLHNTSRNNLINLSTNNVIDKPVISDEMLKSVFNQVFQRQSQKYLNGPITTSWGNEKDYYSILRGFFKDINNGFTEQQNKYINGKGEVYTDPIKLVKDEKTGAIYCDIDWSHPMAKEADWMLTQLRKTSITYGHNASLKEKNPAPWDFRENLGDNNLEGTIEVNIAKPFRYLMNPTNDKHGQQSDLMKYDIMKQSILQHAVNSGIDNANSLIDFLNNFASNSPYSTGDSTYSAIDNYFLGANGILDEKNNDIILNYIKNQGEKYCNQLKNGELKPIDEDEFDISDNNLGIKFRIENYIKNHTLINDFEYNIAPYRCIGFSIGGKYYDIDTGVFKRQIGISKFYNDLNTIRESYMKYRQKGIKSYKTVMLNLSKDSNETISKWLNENTAKLLIIDKRTESIDEPITDKKGNEIRKKSNLELQQDNKFDDNYKIISVDTYCGTVDGVQCVFGCTIQNKNSNNKKNVLIGVSDKGSDAYFANDIKEKLLRLYTKDGGNVPENVYNSLIDTHFNNFYDYIITKIVYDETNQNGIKNGKNYVDIKLGNEIENYIGINFNEKYTLRIFSDNKCQLLENDENGELILAKNLDQRSDATFSLETIWKYILTYGLEYNINNNKSLIYNPTEEAKNSFGKFIANYINYDPKKHKNTSMYDFMRSDSFYNEFINSNDLFKFLLCQSMHTAFNHNEQNNMFIPGWSFAKMCIFSNNLKGSLYTLSKQENYKDYIKFGGEQKVSDYKRGGKLNGLIKDCDIISLSNGLEGIVHIENTSEGIKQYVFYSDDKGLYAIPIDSFLSKDKKFHIGTIQNKYIKNQINRYTNK